MSSPDHLYRFVFEHANVRGEFVQLEDAYQEVLRRREYPPVLRDLMGRGLAAAALLVATVKFRGSLVLQAQGEGPLSLFVVQAGSNGGLRAMARWEGELAERPLGELCTNGYLAITIDPEGEGERYQGIVGLQGEGLAEALDAYFRDSEQLETRVWLAADGERAAGLLVQRLPGDDPDEDAWNRAEKLAETVTEAELLALPVTELLHRLYHEEDLRLFDPVPHRFQCSCSRERVEGMLKSLGSEEVHDILTEQGAVEVACDYCGEGYRFDAVDVDAMFSGEPPTETPPTRH
ncbi:Hsp33 family molecular chaperone HslO [Alkalilimnicola sp. S0819]|uniref:Hsp33 family molecular chaperone HslO n=1 Tax=Alkalilimnicola sp. S0819 TaxID=2613922 RepID=UPI0012618F83|nr:Hsp33 family molecular chaperone HslO [Alkalilimnicola sp. S0819]KAB7623777.1 Hsp33 family molecular chaperone HslO [Alkalilimnicola sp. S0819]MPQ16649.1 Hsp33 family molecular chaperone HslO [Alkalilimnicola sp. S0819]